MQPVDVVCNEPGAPPALAALPVACRACLQALLPVAIALRIESPPPALVALAGAYAD